MLQRPPSSHQPSPQLFKHQAPVHPDARRQHLDIFLPRSYLSSTAGFPSYVAQSQEQPLHARFSSAEDSSSAAPVVAFHAPFPRHVAELSASIEGGGSAATHRHNTTAGAELGHARPSTVHVAVPNTETVHNSGATDLSLLATIIEYSCPMLQQDKLDEHEQQPLQQYQEKMQQQHRSQHNQQQHHNQQQQQNQHQQLPKDGKPKRDARLIENDALLLLQKSLPQLEDAYSPLDARDAATSHSTAFSAHVDARACATSHRRASADWGLATEILLRKTRTDCSRTLLRRHCSRQLHTVVLHWRLVSMRVSDGGCRGNGGAASRVCDSDGGGCCNNISDVANGASMRSIIRRVTWDDKTASDCMARDSGATATNSTRRGSTASIDRDGISLSAAWNANFAAAAAAAVL